MQGAGAGSAGISAASTGPSRSCRRRALGGYGEDRKLGSQVLALTAGAGSALASSNQSLESALALLTDIFKNWHWSLPFQPRIYESPDQVLQFRPDSLLGQEVLVLLHNILELPNSSLEAPQ
jgi:hypothetical protein